MFNLLFIIIIIIIMRNF